MRTNSSKIRAFSARLDNLYRSATAAVSSFRVAMLTRLIAALIRPARLGANYVRQRLTPFRSNSGEAMRFSPCLSRAKLGHPIHAPL
jgi:hypothetical protein